MIIASITHPPRWPRSTLQVCRLHPEAILPKRALEFSVGYDISAHMLTESGRPSSRIIPAQSTSMIPTALVCIPPEGGFLLVCSRSGLASRGVFVANAPGVVDPDYTGEVKVLLVNTSFESHHVCHGDRIAQLLILPLPFLREVEEITVADLPKTPRGASGFGSTGT